MVDIADYAPSAIINRKVPNPVYNASLTAAQRGGYTPNTPARQLAAQQGNRNPTMAQINALNSTYTQFGRDTRAGRNPNPNPNPNLGGLGRSGGGGGGGGGGAATPTLTQEQLNAMYALMQQGLLGGQGPQLDLPDYQAFTPKPFDDSYYTGLQGQWNQAVGQDVGTAEQGTQRLLSWLGQNYSNAFNNPNATYATAGQAPGMDQQAMARLLQDQGVDPSVNQPNVQAQATADAGFGNLWRTLAANEDRNQTNRLGAVQMQGQDAVNAIRAQGLGGTAGINMQRGQALNQYNQRAEDWAREDAALQQQIAQQEAMSNWTQGNTTREQTQAYRNAALEALLGILPGMAGTGLTLPTAQQLGWG